MARFMNTMGEEMGEDLGDDLSAQKAFEVRRPPDVAEKRILLDDVFTTGTTWNACAMTLRKADVGPIFALTLARTIDASLVPNRLFAKLALHPLTTIGM